MNQKRRTSFSAAAFSLVVALSLVVGAMPAWATVEEDQSDLSEEEIAAAIASGEVNTVDEQAVELFSEAEYTPLSSDAMKAFSGSDRYDTAAKQAVYGWSASKSEYVIVAGSNGWPDALAASSLAGALECPVLLTPADSLASSTSDAIAQIGASKVIIVGGEPTVSANVKKQLEGKGLAVERLEGADRFGTQLAIYQYGIDNNLWDGSRYVAATSGYYFTDALSFAPAAYQLKIPVFLTDEAGNLSAEQERALSDAAKNSSSLYANQTILLGGTNRVSVETDGYLKGLSSGAGGAGSTKRLAGSDRYSTSAAIASWAVNDAKCLKWDDAAFATGTSPNDALGGGALQGKDKSVLLLVADIPNNPVIAAVDKGQVSTVKFFGGKPSVPMTVRMDIADKFGFSYSDIVGLKVYIDAGHGPNSSNDGALDTGATGSGTTEWALTKELSQKVGAELRGKGIDVYVNDKGGWYKLRQAEAKALGCDLVVSIHFNAGGGSGTESYIHTYNASWMSASLQSKVHKPLVSAMGLADRGQKKMELAVCSGMPAVLLEICFIDKQSDVNTYKNRIDQVAKGIADGIAS